MPSAPETVRIAPSAHAALREIADAKHIPMTEALTNAVETYRRQVFLEGLASDYAALRADPKAWAEEQADLEVWDTAIADGLEDE